MAENIENKVAEAAEAAEEMEMEASEAAVQVEATAEEAGKKKKKAKKPVNRKKLGVTLGVIAAIVIVAGAGFWKWHETPEFCNAFCHNMDSYYDTYVQEQGVEGTDKWGNSVSNTDAMMAVLHSTTGTTALPEMACMDCHKPVLKEQVSEGVSWLTGNYFVPLDERSGAQLTAWTGYNEDQFCSNGSCHVYLQGENGEVNHEKLAEVTSSLTFNPHEVHHDGDVTTCTSCHKGHRASVFMCTACHDESDGIELPDGWVTYQESQELITTEYGR